jgi:hypothetical protein
VSGQPEVADDGLVEEAVDVGSGGDLEPREGLLGHASAPDHVTPLEHEHAQAGPAQIAGGHQTVVTGPDDDGVVPRGGA